MSSAQAKKSSSKNPNPPSPKRPSPPPKAAAALAKVERELDDVRPEDRVAITIDIPQAVSIVLGVLPGLMELRPELVAQLPRFKIGLLDHLEEYALASWFTHLLALPGAGPGNPVKPLIEEGAPLRANLLSDAEALARRGLLDAGAVAEIRAGQGNVDMANDLVALSALFIANWPAIAGKTAATQEEIQRAGDLGPRLLAALGIREHGAPAPAGDAADRRVRAFSLFVHAYDQVRRAVAYLRWDEGDADLLAPSLYKGRGSRGSRPDTPEPPAATEPALPPATTPA